MAVIQRDTQHHTYRDYVTWSKEYGEELIDGVAYVREPPAPSRAHQDFVLGLYHQIFTALEGKSCHVYAAPFDVRLPKTDETDDQTETVVQPDVLIVCDVHKLDERGMRGAPDWLTEVLSPSTARHDLIIKLPVYERAGVREVWFIHPTDLMLTIYRLEDGRYGRPAILEIKGRTSLTAVPGVVIDWDRMLAHLV